MKRKQKPQIYAVLTEARVLGIWEIASEKAEAFPVFQMSETLRSHRIA